LFRPREGRGREAAGGLFEEAVELGLQAEERVAGPLRIPSLQKARQHGFEAHGFILQRMGATTTETGQSSAAPCEEMIPPWSSCRLDADQTRRNRVVFLLPVSALRVRRNNGPLGASLYPPAGEDGRTFGVQHVDPQYRCLLPPTLDRPDRRQPPA